MKTRELKNGDRVRFDNGAVTAVGTVIRKETQYPDRIHIQTDDGGVTSILSRGSLNSFHYPVEKVDE